MVLPAQVRQVDRQRVHGVVEAGVDGKDEHIADPRGVGLEGLQVELQVRPQLEL